MVLATLFLTFSHCSPGVETATTEEGKRLEVGVTLLTRKTWSLLPRGYETFEWQWLLALCYSFGVSSVNKLHQPDGLLFGTDLNTGLLSFPVSNLRTKSSLAPLVVITTVANPCWLIRGGLLGLIVTITDLHAYIRGPLIHPSTSAAWLTRQLQRYIIVKIFTLKTHSWTKSLLQALLTSRNLKLPLWWGRIMGSFLGSPSTNSSSRCSSDSGLLRIDVGLGGSFSGASMPGWSSRSAEEPDRFGDSFHCVWESDSVGRRGGSRESQTYFLKCPTILMLARTVDLILRTLHTMRFKSHGEDFWTDCAPKNIWCWLDTQILGSLMVSKLPRVGHEFLLEIYTHGSLRVIDLYFIIW